MAKFTGPWNRAVNKLKDAKDWVAGPAEEEVLRFGFAVADEVTRNMESSPPPALKAATVERKTQEGWPYPERTWYESGWLIKNAFDVSVESIGKRGNTSVAVLTSNKKHPKWDIPASTLFNYLEFGTPTIAPRPVFTPVIQSLQRGDSKLLEEFRKSLADKIKFDV